MTNLEQNNELQIQSPQSLIALAIQHGADVDKLEKLMALKERWDAQQANKLFLAAMCLFQKDVPTIEKKKAVGYASKTGGSVSYKYAELGEIDETIKSAMSANGLSKRWEINEEGEKIICTCIISHFDGHTEKTSMSSIKDASGGKSEIQARASAITYLQRYTLIGALGLTTASEDNDADGTPPAVTSTAKTYTDDNRPWLSEDQFKSSLEKILKGEAGILEKLETQFKMKKAYKEQLQTAKPEHKDYNDECEPFVIPGHWHRKMELCKTKADVLEIYKKNKETVDANPELQALLKETQNSFTKQTA